MDPVFTAEAGGRVDLEPAWAGGDVGCGFIWSSGVRGLCTFFFGGGGLAVFL